MQTGIIGLPQVGKTTLFRILTKAHVEGKGGASATHVGVAKVPEPRLVELAKLYSPKKITYATVNYVDLGGMEKERMRDALAQLREVDVIAHVIRVFDDPSVPHSEGRIGEVQSACGGGEGAAGVGVDAGGKKIDWRIFVFVGASGVVCAEPGGRRSGQAGHGGGAAQIERAAGAAECGGGGDLRAAGGGTFRNG